MLECVHDFAVYIQLHTRRDVRYPADLWGARYRNFFCYTVFRIPSGNSFVFFNNATPDIKLIFVLFFQKMQEQLTKQSPTLERDAVYTKTVRIADVTQR